jgi:hypothetical protein
VWTSDGPKTMRTRGMQHAKVAQVPRALGIFCDAYRLRFRVYGLGFRVLSLGFKVEGLMFRALGSGFRVQGSGFRV